LPENGEFWWYQEALVQHNADSLSILAPAALGFLEDLKIPKGKYLLQNAANR